MAERGINFAAAGYAAQSQLRQFADITEVVDGAGLNIAIDGLNDVQDRSMLLILPPPTDGDGSERRPRPLTAHANDGRRQYAVDRKRISPFYSRYTDPDYDEGRDYVSHIETLANELEEAAKEGHGEAVDLDSVVDQSHDSVWQNVYSYAAIAIVLSAFVFFVAHRTFFQTLVAFDVFFFLVSHLNGRIQLLNSRYQRQISKADKNKRAPTPPSRPLMQTGSLVLGIISQLLIFAFVTVVMSKVTPIVRESALAPSTLARMAILPGLWIGT